MDAFSYTDIFDTKGIEYLIVIGFLLLIIPFWVLLNRPLKLKEKAWETAGILSERILRIPQGLMYSCNHTWTFLEKSGLARVGIDDLLLHLTGGVQLEYLAGEQNKIRKGDVIARIARDGKELKIASPISGEIERVHASLEQQPGVLNEDPYGSGWICKIRPENWMEETRSCYVARDATEWINKELSRFKDFITESMNRHLPEPAPVIMQEGGELTDAPLSEMNEKVWKDFQARFLDVKD